jgi:flagellin
MGLDIQTNVGSLLAQQNLNTNQMGLTNTFNQLSSGYRINSAADDAAGLAIGTSMDFQVKSYTVAERNANDAVSMAQTADGALGQITDIMSRMQELAMEGANGDMSTSDRSYLQTEYTQLQGETARIMTSTTFNGTQLLTKASSSITFQVGITNSSDNQIAVTFGGVLLSALIASGGTTSNVASAGGAQASLGTITTALQAVSTLRAKFGAAINRFQDAASSISTQSLNIQAAQAQIMDVDVAQATATLSQQQVLTQAGASVLSQANQAPQLALKLLQ